MSDIGIADIDPSQIAIVGELSIVICIDVYEHWLVIVTRDGRVFETDSGGWGELFKEQLSARMGVALDYKWRNHPGYVSRVIHPPELRDHDLYKFKDTSVPRKFLGIFNLPVSPRIEWHLAPEIQSYIEAKRQADEAGGKVSQL